MEWDGMYGVIYTNKVVLFSEWPCHTLTLISKFQRRQRYVTRFLSHLFAAHSTGYFRKDMASTDGFASNDLNVTTVYDKNNKQHNTVSLTVFSNWSQIIMLRYSSLFTYSIWRRFKQWLDRLWAIVNLLSSSLHQK